MKDKGIRGRLRELVVGILIVADLIAILLMAMLTALSYGDGFSTDTLARSAGRLGLFLGVLVSLGLLIVPRSIRAVSRLNHAIEAAKAVLS